MSAIEDRFFDIWKRFLEFEIIRSKHCLALAGSANAYLVLQVICWHQLLNIGETLNDVSFETTIDQWYEQSGTHPPHPKRLTYSLIAELTGLDKETVRRNVKAHEARGWVTTSRERGICFSANNELNSQLIELNRLERELLAKFTSVLTRYGAVSADAHKIVAPTG
ncbi:MAG: hypothetical protein CMM73_06105 [Rhodospirillaceae bacterium]|nr:hypothetical protein [Rhodospirillaceae bacterium]